MKFFRGSIGRDGAALATGGAERNSTRRSSGLGESVPVLWTSENAAACSIWALRLRRNSAFFTEATTKFTREDLLVARPTLGSHERRLQGNVVLDSRQFLADNWCILRAILMFVLWLEHLRTYLE